MPITSSAIKSLRKSRKNEIRNTGFKKKMKDAIKALQKMVSGGEAKTADIQKSVSGTVSLIDRAVKKNLIHKNKAGRKKSQIAKLTSEKKETKKASK
ncbi:MAG: 30S ribosomal protein S20 [Candidatus Gracilibacteria bacterium]